jgi:multidrug efflux pump
MTLSEPFIRRPVATSLLALALALAGALAFLDLPVAPLPQVEYPTIVVSAALPGASPETMASAVATPLERQFGRIAGVTEMTSSSAIGSTTVVLQFDLSRDIDAAARDVQAAINAARGQLPANLPSNPSYRKVNPADAPAIILSLSSETVPTSRIYDIASSVLAQEISQTDGVGQVTVGGGALPAVRVELNPNVLNKYGISLENVRTVLEQANANRPIGQLSDEGTSWELHSNDQLLKAANYLPLIIAARNGASVRLADVATVTDSVQDVRVSGLVNGHPAVVLVIQTAPGANVIETVDRIQAALPRYRALLPTAVDLNVALDRTTTIRASVRDVERTLIIAIGLVVLVVLGFLGSGWATVIPSVAVPLSLLGTFGAMWFLGYSLDNLSLMALTISTGFVVDDAIVVLENIKRHIDEGRAPLDAALTGAREVGFTVLSMSLSLVAVFIPLLFMGGLVGRIFREFAVTLSVAVAVSLIVSLTLTPMLCSRFLTRRQLETGPVPRRSAMERLSRWSERGFDRLRAAYDRSLGMALAHAGLTLTVLLLTAMVNWYLIANVSKGFFPQQDNGLMMGTIQANEGTSFQALRDIVADDVRVLRRDPGVSTVVAIVGGNTTANQARLFIALAPRERGPGRRSESADAIIARLRPSFAHDPRASVYLQAAQDIRVGGRVASGQYQYTLQGDDLPSLNTWAPRLAARLRQEPLVVDVNTDQQDRGLDASVVIDRDTAARLGVSTNAIDQALYDAFGQRQVSILYTGLNQYRVVMEVAPEYWQQPDTLNALYVGSTSGTVVPLSAVAHFGRSLAPLAVSHQAQFPAITLSFNLRPGASLGEAVSAIDRAARDIGMPATLHGSFQGTARVFQQSLANEPWLIVAALAAVYIVLGILYESLVHPLTILSTLPAAGVGAMLALIVMRTDFTVIALIGLILLIGIVKKNAIMMIDVALDAQRRESLSPEDAIRKASLLRLRPILMTTMAAMLGALPMAINTGTGSELRRPLGITIIGGLLVSQVLTLYTTPVLYLFIDRTRLRLTHWGHQLARVPIGAVVILLCSSLLASCAVGPRYVPPQIETPPAFKEQAPDGTASLQPAEPQDQISRQGWWERFGDQQLNALETQLQSGNPSIAQAEARYREARALVQQNRSEYFPLVTGSASATRNRLGVTSPARGSSGTVVTDYALGASASWEPDLWGRIRQTVAASTASAQAAQGDVENSRLSLGAELAADYFQLRSFDAELALFDQTIEAFQRAATLTRNQYDAGIVSRSDVEQADTQLASAQAQAVDVRLQRAQLEHAIAVLVGEPPASLSLAPIPLDGEPPVISAGVPSRLLERRPDIAAAERRVAAANAQIGVASAAFFPSVTLGGSLGLQATHLVDWLSWPMRVWSVGPALAATLFDGGARRAIKAGAIASYDDTVAAYRQTVLAAFQDVEDNLAAQRLLEEEAAREREAVTAAQRSLDISLNQYRAGLVSYLQVATQQTALLTNQRAAVSLTARRFDAAVQLVRALGGGWTT